MGKRAFALFLIGLLAVLPGCGWLFAPPERVIYVDAGAGDDMAGNGSQASPYRTLTRALADPRLEGGWQVRLAPGTYDSALGEAFPIEIPPGVAVAGAGPGHTRIVGPYATMADFETPVVIGAEGASLLQVGVSNSPPGYGVGFYSETSGRVEGCEFSYLNAGIWLQGGDCALVGNEIHHTFTDTGIMLLGDNSSEVRDNHLFENDVGILVGDSATPVLRGNRIENSTYHGILVTDQALPDLGTEASPGGNSFSGSEDYHLTDERILVLSPTASMSLPPIPAVGNEWEGIAPTGTVCGPLDAPPYFKLRSELCGVRFSAEYDLVANAPLADWGTDTGPLPFPGSPGDPAGAAFPLERATLEDGGVYSGVLATYPPQAPSSWIEGRFPIVIPAGAEFTSDFGFLAGAGATDGVIAEVLFSEYTVVLAIPAPTPIISETHVHEGELLPLAADLSSLEGARGRLVIRVRTGASGDHDWAAWVNPRVYSSLP